MDGGSLLGPIVAAARTDGTDDDERDVESFFCPEGKYNPVFLLSGIIIV
jgi:hypothetical protein